MNPETNRRPAVWAPPWSFLGVARFAQRSSAATLFWAAGVALVIGAACLFFLASAWAPALNAAIAKLPDRGQIRRGQLEWPEPSPQVLIETHFLSIGVDLGGTSKIGEASDVGVKFCRNEVR